MKCKVLHLINATYQVVEIEEVYEMASVQSEQECETVVFQGSLADCEAYIRLKQADLFG